MKLVTSSSDGSSLSQQLVDQILRGNDHQQRNGVDTSQWTTLSAKPPKIKKQQPQQQEQQPQPKKMNRYPQIVTRARGSSGLPPPTKLELEDLKGLSPEELRLALYSDPDLADAYQSSKKRSSSSKNRSKSKRHQEPIRNKAEEGVPIFQWIVVLALLGLLFYQLRKILTLPEPSTKHYMGKKNKDQKRETKPKSKISKRSIPPNKATLTDSAAGTSKP